MISLEIFIRADDYGVLARTIHIILDTAAVRNLGKIRLIQQSSMVSVASFSMLTSSLKTNIFRRFSRTFVQYILIQLILLDFINRLNPR